MRKEIGEKTWPKARILLAVSKSVRRQVIKNQSGECAYCHKPIGNKLEMHHKVPKSHGGSDSIPNIVGLCGEDFDDCHNEWDNLALKNGTLPDGTSIAAEQQKQRNH
jgi:5-methylcytosine-specific restriction endonuclease McrA